MLVSKDDAKFFVFIVLFVSTQYTYRDIGISYYHVYTYVLGPDQLNPYVRTAPKYGLIYIGSRLTHVPQHIYN